MIGHGEHIGKEKQGRLQKSSETFVVWNAISVAKTKVKHEHK